LFPTGLANADAALMVTKAAATAFFVSPWFVWNEEESSSQSRGHALMGSVTQALALSTTNTEPGEDCRSLGRADRAATSAEPGTIPYRSTRAETSASLFSTNEFGVQMSSLRNFFPRVRKLFKALSIEIDEEP
jgi:hypothetical protein